MKPTSNESTLAALRSDIESMFRSGQRVAPPGRTAAPTALAKRKSKRQAVRTSRRTNRA